ncbi:hypothetical protein CFP56_004880 [Quercus suber]|uniref:Uncharacterized protein n=1 Tax=Quercus suber TaxID=58331 RepID=A0AAW0L9V3_QUESU
MCRPLELEGATWFFFEGEEEKDPQRWSQLDCDVFFNNDIKECMKIFFFYYLRSSQAKFAASINSDLLNKFWDREKGVSSGGDCTNGEKAGRKVFVDA